MEEKIIAMREFLRDSIRLETDFENTDQALGKTMPAVQKPPRAGQKLISLPDPMKVEIKPLDLRELISNRKSVRSYRDDSITLDELSWLLYATQGVRKSSGNRHVFRTVPSAGNRHPFETYVSVHRVEGLSKGIYRYLPLEHSLVLEREIAELEASVNEAALGQRFAGNAAVNFIWSVIPYRTEWSYSQVSVKVIAMDIGHVCENLYLAASTIDCGTCEIGAYHQHLADQLLELDGQDEFVIAMCPVGKLKK